ncbi:hypothetical protein KAW18_08920 [candidate division WOR-3 bacterium]|nr:hypothetical protein [candidate division WOR-3 bacterium]MCK4527480.1 hypothetical protein [candidate division WOR-3 bacterium]
MLIILISFISPSLNNSGDIFYGFYPWSDSSYNSDVSLWVRINLLEINAKTHFFLQYSTYLEMAEQKGKVVLDPAYAIYSIIGGFQYSTSLYFSSYIDHYCRHIIDRDLEDGKAVFNALNFVLSNVSNPAHRFNKDIYLRLAYLFYPQGIIVDWLNSKPYYRHRLFLDIGKKITPSIQLTLKTEYTLSNDEPRRKYHQIRPGVYLFHQKENQTIYIFFHYYLTAKDPLHSPNHLLLIGTGFSF